MGIGEMLYEPQRGESVDILDHGLLRLVDYMGGDLSVVRNARVSYDAEWLAGVDQGSDTKLIKYLMKNGHNTPFESVCITFEAKAPIFVFRQWHRHRTQSYNELSARYRPLPEEFYIPDEQHITLQSEDNKQMRTAEPHPRRFWIQGVMEERNRASFQTYKRLLEEGCPRELARSVLPVGTYSHMFATANLHNWLNFCAERCHPHAQYEIRVYAVQIIKMLWKIAPVAVQAWVDKVGYDYAA